MQPLPAAPETLHSLCLPRLQLYKTSACRAFSCAQHLPVTGICGPAQADLFLPPTLRRFYLLRVGGSTTSVRASCFAAPAADIQERVQLTMGSAGTPTFMNYVVQVWVRVRGWMVCVFQVCERVSVYVAWPVHELVRAEHEVAA